MAIGAKSAAHEMLMVLEKVGGSLAADTLKKWDPSKLNAGLPTGYFSRNFGSNMYTLLSQGYVTQTIGRKTVDRTIALTDVGRKELQRLIPKAVEKEKRYEEYQRLTELTEKNFADWELWHRDTKLLGEFLAMGFTEDVALQEYNADLQCGNPRCQELGGGHFGALHVLKDGNLEVQIFECTCTHQTEIKMKDITKGRKRKG